MFNLKTEPSELRSTNQNLNEFNYRQLAPQRNATGNTFSRSEIRFSWQTSGRRWVDMARSFIRMRVKLRNGNGTILTENSDVAFAMDAMSGMWSGCEFRIAETTVSQVTTNVAQVSALKARSMKSKAWLDSIGASTRMLQPTFEERRNEVSNSGATSVSGSRYIPRLTTFAGASIDETQDTVAFARAAGTYTWIDVNGDGLDLTNSLAVGDLMELSPNPPLVYQARITALTALVMTVTIEDAADVGADVATAAGANNAIFNIKRIREPDESRRAGGIELIWQPPLSVFDQASALPAGRYELVLHPQPQQQWQQGAVQSVRSSLVATEDNTGLVGGVFLEVEQIYFDLAEAMGPRVDDATYFLDLSEISCQRKDVTSGLGLDQHEFSTPASTSALTVAFQDQRAGSNTLFSPSQFLLTQQVVAGFVPRSELELIRLFLEYAGQKRPRIDADPRFKQDATAPEDYSVARYLDSLIQSGGYFRDGGAESIQDWHDRGAYYMFKWPRDGSDRSTRVMVHWQFRVAVDSAVLLLFSHYRRLARIKVENGTVVEVRVQDQ